MIRNIKVLAITAMAALAITAVAASAAQAEVTKFTAGSSSGTLKSTQTTKQVFNTVNGKVECNTATMEGSFSSASFTSATLAPTYEGCKAFGFLSATVTPNGCTYTFTGKENTATESTLATATVNCSGTNKIVVSTIGCTTKVGAQGPLNHVKFTNNTSTSPDDVDATATLSGIEYTAEGCTTNGTFNTGTLEGGSTIKAFNGSTQVNLTVDP